MTAAMKNRPKGLGRGLEALLGRSEPEPAPLVEPRPGDGNTLALSRLRAGRYQPRTRMDESALEELAASLRQHGMMQPIVVRPLGGTVAARDPLEFGPSEPDYEIVAGERRFRAAKLAGMTEVPVIVRNVPDEQALALALIENIQREDLNPLEEAQAIKRLIDEFGYSHEKAAESIGRSRSTTTNLLRLLNLAAPVQTMLLAGDIDMGHARALLTLDRAMQILIANQVAEKRLSVRDTEALVNRAATTAPTPDASANGAAPAATVTKPPIDRDLARLIDRLADTLGTTVDIRTNARGGGKLVIRFTSADQFDGLLDRLGLAGAEH